MKMHSKGLPFVTAIAAGLLALTPVESVAREVTSAHDEAEGAFRVERDGEKMFQYRSAPNPYKPYVEYFATPGGLNVLRDAPADHLHHHGLMFAITVNGANFWEEHDAPGRQTPQDTHEVVQTVHDGFSESSYRQALDWLPPDADTPVLTESRTVTLRLPEDEEAPAMLTWTSALTAPEGGEPAELTGSHYHGLGARFLEAMDEGGNFVSPVDDEPEHVRGSEYLVRAPWQAYTAEVNGAPVTFAMFCRPDNPRHPAWWFIMDDPFAYLSATLRLHEEPLTLEPGETLELVYGVALWDGAQDAETIADAFEAWLEQR
ncbi:MAG: DUF6807 family protein [Candidatus Hydrogenedentota bacterium]